MANLNDLALTGDTINDVDVKDTPLFSGGMNIPPQPGIFVGQLPPGPIIFNSFDTEEVADQGQRLVVVFADESAIWLPTLNQPYRARISNRVRYIPVKDKENPGEKKMVGTSKMAQLLRVVNSIPEANNNVAYGNALVRAGGRLFKFKHTLTATCSKNRDIWKDGAVVKGKKGCGARFMAEPYEVKKGDPIGQIPKDENGKFATRFQCHCGATLSAWGDIESFQKHQDYPPTSEQKSEE